jgi:hypothetical protein
LSVRQTSDGGFIVGGDANYVVSSSYTESEITVFKLDSTGALVWQRDYAAGTGVYFDSLALTSDGGFIVSASVDQQQTSTSYTSSVLLLKLDSTGNTQFARTIAAGLAPTSLTKASLSTPANRSFTLAGPSSLFKINSLAAKPILPQCGLWLSSGSASCSCAGVIASLMTKQPTSIILNAEAHISPANSTKSSLKPLENLSNNSYSNP